MLLTLLQFFATKFLYLALHLDSGSFPRPLTPKEEVETFAALRAGDPAAREKLIRHNLRLVAHITKKYYAQPGDQEDLISIGTIGLMKAVDTFDSTRKARFSTYASRCIENAILSPAHFIYRPTVCAGAATVSAYCRKTLPPWSAWKNGSTGTLKAAISAGASPRRLRTSWLPSIPFRSKTFWMTTPCFSTGAEGLFSENTAMPKAGIASSLPTTPRLAGQAFAAGRPDRKPSVKSVSSFWPKILGPIFFLCCACEVW